jgi:hypothetical protein
MPNYKRFEVILPLVSDEPDAPITGKYFVSMRGEDRRVLAQMAAEFGMQGAYVSMDVSEFPRSESGVSAEMRRAMLICQAHFECRRKVDLRGWECIAVTWVPEDGVERVDFLGVAKTREGATILGACASVICGESERLVYAIDAGKFAERAPDFSEWVRYMVSEAISAREEARFSGAVWHLAEAVNNA